MADYLDIDLAIAEIDPVTKEIKATPYFENYLHEIIDNLGGEGSTTISTLVATTIDSGKTEYVFAQVKAIKRQLDEVSNEFRQPVLSALIKQLQIDTAKFNSRIETSNYTAINKDWVEARNGITVDLPANPVRDDEIMVSNGDGTTITVDGNGNNIKYTTTDTSIITYKQGTSLHFHYFIDNVAGESYWRVQ